MKESPDEVHTLSGDFLKCDNVFEGGVNMMKKHSLTQFRPSTLRIAGLLMIISGLALIFSFDLKNKELAQTGGSEETTSTTEVSIISEYSEKTENAREVSAAGLPFLTIGGILILGGIPMFFVPYTDKGVYLRRKKDRKKKEEEVPEADPEFDYPDDDYDFIIRRETYELLHKEQLENIRKKHDKQ